MTDEQQYYEDDFADESEYQEYLEEAQQPVSDSRRLAASDADEKVGGPNWFFRIALGILGVLVLSIIVAFIAYNEVKSDRSKPLDIKPYPGMEIQIDEQITGGVGHQYYQGFYEGLTPDRLADIEKHYRDQMDSCVRLWQFDPEQFHTIVCDKDRSHNVLGFTQFARLRIQPERDGNGDLTGWVTIDVDLQWEN
ncbi:MAG: hypothetical protein H6673_09560 [Anaerolineales bacterium]|nr:hypothetical protein [Anaerolineales bacterium]